MVSTRRTPSRWEEFGVTRSCGTTREHIERNSGHLTHHEPAWMLGPALSDTRPWWLGAGAVAGFKACLTDSGPVGDTKCQPVTERARNERIAGASGPWSVGEARSRP